MSEETGWVIIGFYGLNHIMPGDEVEMHRPRDCACCPFAEYEDETIIIHNSFDGREAFERGDRKPS